MKKILMVALLLTTACRPEKPKPVDIEPGDICSSCKMAISQKRYAAEFIDREGTAVKFDDIGCMFRFVKARALKDSVEAWFVMDYRAQHWMPAENATYVRSAALPSPMGSGLIALENRAYAEEYSQKYRGKILTFEDLGKQ